MKDTKMRIDILSAVPEIMESAINASIIKKAREKEIVEIYLHDLHDYSESKFRHIDDYPYGGAAGMLIRCEPLSKCIEFLKSQRNYNEIIYMSADGETLNQKKANDLSLNTNIMIIAGHYKGIDQRIRNLYVTKEISIGDFVLSGGELPAIILTDALVRLLPGVLGDMESALEDSYMDGLLEPPQYTRPEEFMGLKVPEVLLGGNHKEIQKWKLENALEKTKKLRNDLYEKYIND